MTENKAAGGTELMVELLGSSLPEELLNEFQIIPSRIGELDESKYRIFWAHDLPGDPGSDPLRDGGWNKFHRLVFVSHWQMQAYINFYNIPWTMCMVLQNGIMPLPKKPEKTDDTIRLIYTPTPHRGLNILLPVFSELCKLHENIELDVYSSFKLYGWDDKDKQFQALIDYCNNHPSINYHGTVSNDQLREALLKADIFAYPSTWMETSCRCLIEAMSAGLVCVHSNYGALYETASHFTAMYQYQDRPEHHSNEIAGVLHSIISALRDPAAKDGMAIRLQEQKSYADRFYSWPSRALQWRQMLEHILGSGLPREFPKPSFQYST